MPLSGSNDREVVFQILNDLDAISFAHLIADLCAVRGWKPNVTIANSNHIGDVQATKSLPYPESTSILHYDDGELTTRRIEELVSKIPSNPTSRLSIIVHRPLGADVVELAHEKGIGIIGLSDIAESVIMLSTVGILETYVENDDELQEKYGSIIQRVGDKKSGHRSDQSTVLNPSESETSPQQDSQEHRSQITFEESHNADVEAIEREVDHIYDSLQSELRGYVEENPDEVTSDLEFEDGSVVIRIQKANRRIKALLLASEIIPLRAINMVTESNSAGVEKVRELCELYERNQLTARDGKSTEETLEEVVIERMDTCRDATHEIISHTLQNESG
ncbi:MULTISPECIES: hypothetical protein [Haloferax]|uniref:Uncharacterized protein n=2 Tax=Haloferax TaxID=2251 RepID=A0A6G1Z7I1_9EURY|nr:MULTISPECIES: hypothetical protein [Haloferax]KAB1184821.1 hypothetical protein Hfx1149_17310 [Haloferax sp. CBA1149]MRW82453.1 hypothetical protein [Haloferax marinisediminis]